MSDQSDSTPDQSTSEAPAPGDTRDSPDLDTSTATSSTADPTADPAADSSSGTETIGADEPGLASDTIKDPSDWVTGDEPMTGAQKSYLDTLARRAGEQLPAELTKAEASEHIDRLQSSTSRATGAGGAAGDTEGGRS